MGWSQSTLVRLGREYQLKTKTTQGIGLLAGSGGEKEEGREKS